MVPDQRGRKRGRSRVDGDRKLANRYGDIRTALGNFAPNPLVNVNREVRTVLIAEAREIRANSRPKAGRSTTQFPSIDRS